MLIRKTTLLLSGCLCLSGLYALSCGGAETPAASRRALADKPERERLPGARQHFQHVKDTLLKSYYDDSLTEDDLYLAAIKGMLAFADPKMESWNKLLEPDELAEMRLELSGELTGIGLVLKFDEASGNGDVLGFVPGGAAERAGLQAGDKVLSVNGRRYQGKTLKDMVYDIRGKAGEAVALTLLRGDQIVHKSVVRERLRYDNVRSGALPGRIGYLAIRSFNAQTERAVRGAVAELQKQGLAALILDLRGNQGGAFDPAVAVSGLFLPRDQPVVRVVRRGGKEEVLRAKGEPLLSGVPLAVLVDGKTSSGAEILTAALREGARAQVVGERTFGKWSVQMVDDLGERFAIKYTVSLFRSPSGQSYEGQGLQPDVPVGMGADPKAAEQAERARDPAQRLPFDAPLRAAARLLTR